MKRAYQLLAASCSVLALSPALAQGVGNFVDAAQFSIDASSPFTLAVGGTSNQRLAQTLTVEVGGTLEGVFLPILCGDGKVLIEIRDVVAGQPGAAVLAHRNVAPTQFDTLGRFTYIPIPGALPLAAGQLVAIVMDDPKGSCACMPSPASSNYPGGQGFFEALPNPPGWVPFSDFPGTADDLPFQLVLS